MLSEPMEILELGDGETKALRVVRWEWDQAIIRPAHAPQGKGIAILRLHVPPEDKPIGPKYWDVTGKGAIALLWPHLQTPAYAGRVFLLSAVGVAPKKRFSLEVK